jgi:hypothetical protein
VALTLPFFADANYVLTRDCEEYYGEFREEKDETVTVGWELRVPQPGPDGVPFLFIFPGPTAEHGGAALHLKVAGLPVETTVLVESFYKDGSERAVIFEGTYGDVKDGTAAAQRRVEAGHDYRIRIGLSIPPAAVHPNLDDASFELECVKLWWNETA